VAPSNPSTPPRPSSSSSSTRKAAKLAQKGRGKRVRFQGGTIFPAAVAAVLVIGVGTIVYARQSVPAADSSPPQIEDHWHIAYGFYLCDTWYQLQGNLEETNSQGQLVNSEFLQTGVHSHDDGVIHWHPYGAKAVGRRADLGVFLDVYDVELTNDELRFPEGQPINAETRAVSDQRVYEEGETKCGNEDGELRVVVWDNYTDTDDGTTYISNFDDIRITNNSMVMSIAFAPRDADVPMPPWAQDLPALGAVDTGGSAIPPATSVVDGSVVGVPQSVAPDSTEPGASTPGTTTPSATPTTGTTPATGTSPTAGTSPTTTSG
jgi:hypothetical protein